MAEKQAPTKESARDEMQISVGQDTALRKVELDLDDAPFLQEQESSAPAVADSEPLPVAADAADASPKKKKLLLVLAAAGVLVLALAAAAVWWFFFRTPPVKPEPVKPEVVVVPTPKEPVAGVDAVKELAPFVIPRSTPQGARFLICKFSTVSKSKAVGMEIDHKLIPLRDALYYYLSSKSDEYLLNPANAATIKKDLTGVLNDYLTQGRIEDILFESYLNE